MSQLFRSLTTPNEEIAFRLDQSSLSYLELSTRARRYADALRQAGFRPGDRIAVQAETSLELIIALVGHLWGGFIHVPINTRYRDAEIQHILSDSGASILLTDATAFARQLDPSACPMAKRLDLHQYVELSAQPDGDAALSPAALPDDDLTAMLIYTSGTTGKSKGVALSRRALEANVGATTRGWRFSARDHLVLALPLFHVHGLCLGVLGTLLHRMKTTLLRRFTSQSVLDVFDTSASVFMGVPTMYTRLVRHLDAHPESAESLKKARLFTSGSAALPADLHRRFKKLTGHEILERYGMSETGFTLSNPYEGRRQAGTVGFPVSGYQAKVVSDDGALCEAGQQGELWVKGDGLMRGYWNQPEATEQAIQAGWFRTGDVVLRQADGYFRIMGRASADIIKSGGFKISALEIEAVLLEHPWVDEVAVVGIPDPEWGERIVAAVVPSQDSEPLSTATLSLFVRERLAHYKQPRLVLPLESLPRNALGKIQKHLLRPILVEAAARDDRGV